MFLEQDLMNINQFPLGPNLSFCALRSVRICASFLVCKPLILHPVCQWPLPLKQVFCCFSHFPCFHESAVCLCFCFLGLMSDLVFFFPSVDMWICLVLEGAHILVQPCYLFSSPTIATMWFQFNHRCVCTRPKLIFSLSGTCNSHGCFSFLCGRIWFYLFCPLALFASGFTVQTMQEQLSQRCSLWNSDVHSNSISCNGTILTLNFGLWYWLDWYSYWWEQHSSNKVFRLLQVAGYEVFLFLFQHLSSWHSRHANPWSMRLGLCAKIYSPVLHTLKWF